MRGLVVLFYGFLWIGFFTFYYFVIFWGVVIVGGFVGVYFYVGVLVLG